MFKKSVRIPFRNVDAAKIMFFSRVFELAHDAYEDFVLHLGFDFKDWFENDERIIPIVHTSCDYKKSFLGGETYEIQVSVAKLGTSSVTLLYRFMSGETLHAELTMVHVFVNPAQGTKIEIPAPIRKALEAHL